ncbi:O-antigen ligase family protein [Mangrovimonas sp. TPBH4]|uniref:O-antigen ligase family protein n=1 Tax=Mangrovimonas sp. TPBH4 TaxID=1645914 RepID=UPI000B0AB93B|nr:O-antigen ligase family protein [Mangrovimonas sp. TPBH4]
MRLLLNNSIYKIVRPIFLILVTLSVFKGVLMVLFKSKVFEYLDEIVFLISIIILTPIFLLNRKLKLIHFFVGFFIIYSIIVSLIFGMNSSFFQVVFQTLITIKFFIVLLAIAELFKGNYWILNKFFLFIMGVACLGLMIHLILGERFNHFTGVVTFARPNIRYVGFFTHPNHLAYLAVLYLVYLLNLKAVQDLKLTFKDWTKVLILFIVIVLTDSRTAMLAVGILFVVFYWKLIKQNYKLVLSGIVIGIFGLIYVCFFTTLVPSIYENIKDTFDLSSHYIRGNMIYLSGLIFFDFFPFGTGAATFGSVLSGDKVYDLYGQADRYYFANKMGIYDSNVASIVGEYGLLGIIFFIFLFYYLVVYLKGYTSRKTLVVPLVIMFIFYSITNPMLTNNLYALLTALVLVLMVNVDKLIYSH